MGHMEPSVCSLLMWSLASIDAWVEKYKECAETTELNDFRRCPCLPLRPAARPIHMSSSKKVAQQPVAPPTICRSLQRDQQGHAVPAAVDVLEESDWPQSTHAHVELLNVVHGSRTHSQATSRAQILAQMASAFYTRSFSGRGSAYECQDRHHQSVRWVGGGRAASLEQEHERDRWRERERKREMLREHDSPHDITPPRQTWQMAKVCGGQMSVGACPDSPGELSAQPLLDDAYWSALSSPPLSPQLVGQRQDPSQIHTQNTASTPPSSPPVFHDYTHTHTHTHARSPLLFTSSSSRVASPIVYTRARTHTCTHMHAPSSPPQQTLAASVWRALSSPRRRGRNPWLERDREKDDGKLLIPSFLSLSLPLSRSLARTISAQSLLSRYLALLFSCALALSISCSVALALSRSLARSPSRSLAFSIFRSLPPSRSRCLALLVCVSLTLSRSHSPTLG